MLLSFVTALLVFALLSLPGWLLVMDRQRPIWIVLAAGLASQFAVLLFVALLAQVWPGQVEVRFVLLAGAIGAAVVCLLRPPTQKPIIPDGWTVFVPMLATVAALIMTFLAVETGGEGLTVRAWFNADGFTHLGHVHALGSFGLPARDIFAGGGPLEYYWLFYTIPGIGDAIHGDAVGALVSSGLLHTFAFWVLVHGLLKSAGANNRWAVTLALVGWLSPSLDGLLALALAGWDPSVSMLQINSDVMGATLLPAFTLFRISLYVPQHEFMLLGLLSWATLAMLPRNALPRVVNWLSFVPLICAGAVSTLLGIGCLAVFALARSLDTRLTVPRRVAGIIGVGVASLAVPLVLGVVGDGGSGLESPIFENEAATAAPWQRALFVFPGLILAYGVSLLGALGLWRGWRLRHALSEESRTVLYFALALTLAGVVVMIAAASLTNPRLMLEIQLRTSLLPYLGLTVGAVWLLIHDAAGKQRLPPMLVALSIPFLGVGLLTPVHDIVWHAASSPNWSIHVPADDLSVLTHLEREAPTDSVVLQFPELPFVSSGKDVWTPILASRMIFTSPRATRWTDEELQMAQTTAYFSGVGPLPEGDYDFIYLSRALHPRTFEGLVGGMHNTAGWAEKLCLPDACLWSRL